VPQTWNLGDGGEGAGLAMALTAADACPLSSTEPGGVTIDQRALLVYTSGTTVLAKAANVNHR
jgi:fatty-acyl-CoA synthase